jgi:ribosomal protein S12 methylthiotransferase
VVIINACGFIQEAKEQSVETILEACRMKEQGDIQEVVAVGCMVERYRQELEVEIPDVDLCLGLTGLSQLVPGLRDRGLFPETFVPLMEQPLRVLATETAHTSFLKISEGCDHTCAFCAILLMRGLHRSASVEELVGEAAAMARHGVREINVVSQDPTWYGRDLRRRDPSAPLLPDLLDAQLDRTGIDWYRFLYMYPSGITQAIVEVLAEASGRTHGPRILPYLDMLELLEEIRFERVGAFAYSPEEDTPAATMADQVPEDVRRERLEELFDLQRMVSLEKNLDLVGSVRTARVDRVVDDDHEFALPSNTEGQAIDVDGVTWIQSEGTEGVRPGEFVHRKIMDAGEHDLTARMVV